MTRHSTTPRIRGKKFHPAFRIGGFHIFISGQRRGRIPFGAKIVHNTLWKARMERRQAQPFARFGKASWDGFSHRVRDGGIPAISGGRPARFWLMTKIDLRWDNEHDVSVVFWLSADHQYLLGRDRLSSWLVQCAPRMGVSKSYSPPAENSCFAWRRKC